MQRYNIAYMSTDHALNELFVTISRKYFLNLHDEYILGPEGLPHVTLCQFHAPNNDCAITAFKTFTANSDLAITIQKFRLRAGSLANAGKFIADVMVDKSQGLIDKQKECYAHLLQTDIKPLTPSETYSPHITVARLPQLINTPLGIEEEIPTHKTSIFKLVVGASTESGVLVKVLA